MFLRQKKHVESFAFIDMPMQLLELKLISNDRKKQQNKYDEISFENVIHSVFLYSFLFSYRIMSCVSRLHMFLPISSQKLQLTKINTRTHTRTCENRFTEIYITNV